MSILKNVSFKNGSEGPRHDPYSFMEIKWKKDNKIVVLHQGLAHWVTVDGTKHEGSGDNYESLPVEIFEKETGLNLNDIFKELYEGSEGPLECDKCHSKDIGSVPGHPGETFLQCNSCGHTLSTDFNEGVII